MKTSYELECDLPIASQEKQQVDLLLIRWTASSSCERDDSSGQNTIGKEETTHDRAKKSKKKSTFSIAKER